MENPSIFLVMMPASVGPIPSALRYAALKALEVKGRVALLATVQPDDIGAWSGVDQAITDDAFNHARKIMAHYASFVLETSGAEAVTLFQKGRQRDVLSDVLEKERGICAVVLTGSTGEDGGNTLIQHLTSDKGIRKLSVPLIIVPDTFYGKGEEKNVHPN